MTADVEGRGLPVECSELDGCCVTHSPCFREENADLDVPEGSLCEGWPCPHDVTAPARGLSPEAGR